MLIFLISKYIENEVKKDNSTSISRVLLKIFKVKSYGKIDKKKENIRNSTFVIFPFKQKQNSRLILPDLEYRRYGTMNHYCLVNLFIVLFQKCG